MPDVASSPPPGNQERLELLFHYSAEETAGGPVVVFSPSVGNDQSALSLRASVRECARVCAILREPSSKPMSPVHFQQLGRVIDAQQLRYELCHKLCWMSVLDFRRQVNDFNILLVGVSFQVGYFQAKCLIFYMN